MRLWDVATRQQTGLTLAGHTAAVNAVRFDPDGRRLATAGADAIVRTWNPGFTQWPEVGCQLVNRNLSLAEWHDLAGNLDYERPCPDLPVGPGAPADAPAAQY